MRLCTSLASRAAFNVTCCQATPPPLAGSKRIRVRVVVTDAAKTDVIDRVVDSKVRYCLYHWQWIVLSGLNGIGRFRVPVPVAAYYVHVKKKLSIV